MSDIKELIEISEFIHGVQRAIEIAQNAITQAVQNGECTVEEGDMVQEHLRKLSEEAEQDFMPAKGKGEEHGKTRRKK